MPLTPEALTYACERVDAFARVNAARTATEKSDAVNTLFDGLGFVVDLRAAFADWLTDFAGDDYEAGGVMIGVLLGLFINDYRP